MRWGLLWWNLMTVLVSSLGVEEEQVDPKDEPVEPVEPIDAVDQIDQFLELHTTQSTRVAFYEPGTDFFTIPELYRNIKAGKNTSGFYIGPTFSKEFMIKTPSEKRITTGFKLLDWKRRRKRLDKVDEKGKDNSTKGGERTKKGCLGSNDKATGVVDGVDNFNVANEERVKILDGCNDKLIHDNINLSLQIESNDVDCLRRGVKVYTQPVRDLIEIGSTPSDNSKLGSTNRPGCCLKFSNETRKRRVFKKRNGRSRKRPKREEDSNFEDFVEYKRAIPDDPRTDSDKNVSGTTSYMTYHRSCPISTPTSFLTTSIPSLLTNDTLCTTTEGTSEPINVATTTDKEPDISILTKKEVKKEKVNRTCTTTEYVTVTSKAKAKIIIGGDEMPLHPAPKSHEFGVDHSARLLTNAGVVFACVTPPPPTTIGSCHCNEKDDGQRAECHPKGTGPLSPMSFDPEAYGPRNEEEVEDALTGKLADRVVEVVLAKVGKTPRMMKELGLYAQGNLTKIQCSVSHPEGKQACKEQSSEALKLTVLQDIAAAVERLANTKANGLCLKPPEDLSDFLSWMLSEDSEMDMPEPTAHFSLTPRREADYLFRSSGITDELLTECKDIEKKCNWENWMNFVEDSTEDSGIDKVTVPDEFEGKGHVQQQKNFKRMPRHLSHRKRTSRRPGEHGRRRRYTPWSLNDYP